MRLLMLLALLVSFTSLASPQIYPSNVEFMGTGNMHTRITLYNNGPAVEVEVVYVSDITQSEESDVKINDFVLKPDRDITIPINLLITKAKPFWICVKSFDGLLPIRNCTTFKPKGYKL